MECNIQNGTTTNNFFSTLKNICQESNNILQLKIPKIISNQKCVQNRALIIEYKTNKNSLHFVFIFVNDENKHIVVNEGANNKKIPILQYFDFYKYDILKMWIIDKQIQ